MPIVASRSRSLSSADTLPSHSLGHLDGSRSISRRDPPDIHTGTFPMVVRPPCIHPRPYEKTIKGTAEREREKKNHKVKEHVTSRLVPLSAETESDGGEGEGQRKAARYINPLRRTAHVPRPRRDVRRAWTHCVEARVWARVCFGCTRRRAACRR